MTSKILKTRSKPGATAEKKFLGVNVPSELFLYVQLHIAATGNTKSCFINTLIKDQTNKVSMDLLVSNIVERTNRSWRNLKSSTTFDQFLLDLKKDFEHLHIPQYYQEVIITQIKE